MRQHPLKETTSSGDGNIIAPESEIRGNAATNATSSPQIIANGCGTVIVNVNHYPEGSGPDLAAMLEKIDRLEAKIEALAAVVNAGKKGKKAKLTL